MAGTAGRIALIASWVVVVGGVAAGAGYLHSLGPPDRPTRAEGAPGAPAPPGTDLPLLAPPPAHDQAPAGTPPESSPAHAGEDGAHAAPEPAPEPAEHAEAPTPPTLPPLQAPQPQETPGPDVADAAQSAPDVQHLTPPADGTHPVPPSLPILAAPPQDAPETAPDTAPDPHGTPDTAGPDPVAPETATPGIATADAAGRGASGPETGDDAAWPVTTPALHGPLPTVEPRPFDLNQPGDRAAPPGRPAEAPPQDTAAAGHEAADPEDGSTEHMDDGHGAQAAPEHAEAIPAPEDPAHAPPPQEDPPAAVASPAEGPAHDSPAPELPPHAPSTVVATAEPPAAPAATTDGHAAPQEEHAALEEEPAAPEEEHAAPQEEHAAPQEEPAAASVEAPPPAPPTPALPVDGPMVAVIIGGLGLSSGATEAAIQDLPAGVTLSFSPYSGRLSDWIARARAAGHEVLLDLPMEPLDFPRSDPGPYALMTTLDAAENLRRLEWVLSRSDAIVGVGAYMGSRFAADAEAMRPVLEAIRARGLIYLDAGQAAGGVATAVGTEIGLPTLVSDMQVDRMAARPTIDGALAQAEAMAARDGEAVAVGTGYPVTIERVAAWARSLSDRGIALAPISALAAR